MDEDQGPHALGHGSELDDLRDRHGRRRRITQLEIEAQEQAMREWSDEAVALDLVVRILEDYDYLPLSQALGQVAREMRQNVRVSRRWIDEATRE